jgi:hypothetical protein
LLWFGWIHEQGWKWNTIENRNRTQDTLVCQFWLWYCLALLHLSLIFAGFIIFQGRK